MHTHGVNVQFLFIFLVIFTLYLIFYHSFSINVANRCWLKIIPSSPNHARTMNIIFESDATGISTINVSAANVEDWYDLNGRRLTGKPAVKGMYIQNGKKVVIK